MTIGVGHDVVAEDHLSEGCFDVLHAQRGAAFHVMTVAVAVGDLRENLVHVVGGDELLGGADEVRA